MLLFGGEMLVGTDLGNNYSVGGAQVPEEVGEEAGVHPHLRPAHPPLTPLQASSTRYRRRYLEKISLIIWGFSIN